MQGSMVTVCLIDGAGAEASTLHAATFTQAGGSIGTAPHDTLVLPKGGLERSATLARVLWQDPGWVLVDQSHTPVLLNGFLVDASRPVSLAPGDQLQIGAHLLEVREAVPVGAKPWAAEGLTPDNLSSVLSGLNMPGVAGADPFATEPPSDGLAVAVSEPSFADSILDSLEPMEGVAPELPVAPAAVTVQAPAVASQPFAGLPVIDPQTNPLSAPLTDPLTALYAQNPPSAAAAQAIPPEVPSAPAKRLRTTPVPSPRRGTATPDHVLIQALLEGLQWTPEQREQLTPALMRRLGAMARPASESSTEGLRSGEL